jgi:hypothetical protein
MFRMQRVFVTLFCLTLAAAACLAADQPIAGDLNGDGVVDVIDLGILAMNYDGTGKDRAHGDLNGDGVVDVVDLGILATYYDRCRFDATITLTNTTGAARTNWPVFATVWKLFGGNLPLTALNPAGFHVYNDQGQEIAWQLRSIPPDFSLGNDELVFVIPSLASNASVTYRVTNTPTAGSTTTIDLVGNANNLAPNGSFETDSGGVPTGWTLLSGSASQITYDTTDKQAGTRSMKLSAASAGQIRLRTTNKIAFLNAVPYHCSFWARCNNVSYTGYGFSYDSSGTYNSGFACTFDKVSNKYPFSGRGAMIMRDTRPWFNYCFDAGPGDAWGVPMLGSKGQFTGNSYMYLNFYQPSQAFLAGDKSGQIWLDEVIVMPQPSITVNRQQQLDLVTIANTVVYQRPVDMPYVTTQDQTPLNVLPCVHEAVKSIETYAMPGERRQVRFGLYAVNTLSNLTVQVSPLTGPGGSISGSSLDLEILGSYVTPYAPVTQVAAGGRSEYLLGLDVPVGTAAGTYLGTITFLANGVPVRTTPLQLQVLPVSMPNMTGYWAGGIYNVGYALNRDDAFYTCYGKIRFNYLMLFDYFCCQIDSPLMFMDQAQQQVDKLATLSHVTDGIGLYREPNMSEDQPRMWYQIASGDPHYYGPYTKGTNVAYEAGYQALATELETYGKAHNWPQLIYMVTDEPDKAADVDPSMGWLDLALPNAITCADAQYKDMINCWNWYNFPIIDDPADWAGPLMFKFIMAHSGRFGFCGLATTLPPARYQPGLCLAGSGGTYLHFWHLAEVMATVNGVVCRQHNLAAAGAGMTDLRYYVALKQAIAAAGPDKAAIAQAAQAYLNGVFTYCNSDNDRHLLPYNGLPYDWGYDRWYDDWQATMKDYLLGLQPSGGSATPAAKTPSVKVSAAAAAPKPQPKPTLKPKAKN